MNFTNQRSRNLFNGLLSSVSPKMLQSVKSSILDDRPAARWMRTIHIELHQLRDFESGLCKP